MKSYELTKPSKNSIRESLEDIRMMLDDDVEVTFADGEAVSEDSRVTFASERTKFIDDALDIIEDDIMYALQICSIGSAANYPRITRALRSALFLLGKRKD